MSAHDERTAPSLTTHNLARGHAQADRDQDQDQGSGSTALSPNATGVPSSVPRVETFANLGEVESLRDAIRDIQQQNNELAKDRDLADREVRRLRKEADLLRRELQEVREADPKAKMIREILDYWVKALGKSSRTKCPPNGARWNKVRARMNDGFTVDQLKQAVDGCAKVPFVGPKGRQAAEGGGAKRHDDVELICRDETTVERFIGYATEPKPLPVPRIEPRGSYVRRPIYVVLDALEGEVKPSATQHCWIARCPAHDDRQPSLSIREVDRGEGEMVLLNCFAGCKAEDVVAALGLRMSDLFTARERAA